MCHIDPPSVCPARYAVMVRSLSGGECGDDLGWCGCEYLRGLMRAKYSPISCAVGACRRIFGLFPPLGAEENE
jgi:hypothetical protein